MLKAKNQIDLLDFKIAVVGDHPDDWDEIRSMRATIDQQERNLQSLTASEASLSEEVRQLRTMLAETQVQNAS